MVLRGVQGVPVDLKVPSRPLPSSTDRSRVTEELVEYSTGSLLFDYNQTFYTVRYTNTTEPGQHVIRKLIGLGDPCLVSECLRLLRISGLSTYRQGPSFLTS